MKADYQVSNMGFYSMNNYIRNKELNHDCLVRIFQYLPICDRIKLERVNKTWRDASQASWYNLKDLDFSDELWGQDDVPLEEVLSRCGEFILHAKLKPLCGSNIRPVSCIKVIVKMCPNLRTLNLVGIKICANQLRYLIEHCTSITELCIGETTPDCDDALLEKTVFDRFRLKVFEVNSSDYVTGACLRKLEPDTVSKINISYCFRLSFSVALDAFKTFKNLQTLVLRQALSVKKTDNWLFFDFLSSIKLKELDISFNDSVVDDHYLIKLATVCHTLSHLNIGGNYYVTDVGLTAITGLSNLEHLVINWLRKVTGLVPIDLPNLKTLSCCGCYNMEDEGLIKILGTSTRIQLLNVIYCKKVTEKFVFAALRATRNRVNGVPLVIMMNEPEKYDYLELDNTFLLRLI